MNIKKINQLKKIIEKAPKKATSVDRDGDYWVGTKLETFAGNSIDILDMVDILEVPFIRNPKFRSLKDIKEIIRQDDKINYLIETMKYVDLRKSLHKFEFVSLALKEILENSPNHHKNSDKTLHVDYINDVINQLQNTIEIIKEGFTNA